MSEIDASGEGGAEPRAGETESDSAPAGSSAEATNIADDGLLGRLEVIEAQPLAERASRFEQLHDELVAQLQRSDQGQNSASQNSASQNPNRQH